MDYSLCRDLPNNSLVLISKLPDRNGRIIRSVDLFIEEIKYLSQNTDSKVIVCAVPTALLEAMGPEESDDEEDEATVGGPQLDFHDLLKARAMQQYRKPIQIILPATYDESKHRRQPKLGRRRELQDEATRAWNIHTALYYEAGGTPLRLPRASNQLATCYL